jgi:ketopantoate reductase
MLEMKAIAKAAGVNLLDDIVDTMIRADPNVVFWKPRMCQNLERGLLLELEGSIPW